MKIYKEKNKIRLKELRRLYYINNIEKIKQQSKEYKEQHKEYYIEYAKAYGDKWKLKNKDKVKKAQQKYCQNNKEKLRIKNHNRRAKEKNLERTFTLEQWNACKEYFEHKCAYCGTEKKLTQEHFIPVTKGGGYTIKNIIPVCKLCNSRKRNIDFFKWYPEQEFYNKKRCQNILTYLNYKNKI